MSSFFNQFLGVPRDGHEVSRALLFVLEVLLGIEEDRVRRQVTSMLRRFFGGTCRLENLVSYKRHNERECFPDSFVHTY